MSEKTVEELREMYPLPEKRQRRRVDYTLLHNFEVCVLKGTVGSTCPDYLHCNCGQSYDADIHDISQDAGGLL